MCHTFTCTADGDAAPLRTLSGVSTGLSDVLGLAVDAVNNELYVASAESGAATGLSGVRGVALDPMHDELFVVNAGVPVSITVYARTAADNSAPLRTMY